ncbi:MAG: hypothetical protein HW399_734, partial [Dehalococcoidia bacterium]|nr:hypothetical protein [Dehalococcoidia bacterium]
MKKCVLIALTSMLAVLLVLSCAPGATPTAAPDARPVSTPAPVLTSNLPPSTPQEVEWQKVVEAAKKEGKLTVYSFSFVGDLGLALSKAFKDRYG